MSRDFTYIDDIAKAIVKCSLKPATSDLDFDSDNPNPSTSLSPFRIFNIGNRKRAIKEGINLLRKNDIFVIFGKGHERFQLIGNKKKAFSDSDVVLKIIKGL